MHRWPQSRHALQHGIGSQALLLLLVAGSQLTAIVLALGDHQLWPVAIPWLISLLAAVALVQARSGRPPELRFRLGRSEILLVAGLSLLAGALRLTALETLPGGIYGDEGEFGVLALAVTEGEGPAPFGLAFLGDPALYVHLLAPFVDALGPTMQAIRLPSALAGAATVPVLYGLVRDLYGRGPAALAALLLATSAVHIHFSRLALNVVWVPLFACLSLWFLQRGLSRQEDVWYLLAGIAGGLGFYFHFGGRLIALILLLVLAGQFVAAPRRWRHWLRAGGLAALGGLLTLSPLLAHLANNPQELTEHTQKRGIWNHWEDLAARYGTEPSDKAGIVWEQVRATFAAFVTRPDPAGASEIFRFMDEPLTNPILGVLALLGLAALCFQLRKPEARLLLIWFVVPAIFASIVTDVAGQSHRLIHPLVPALVAAAILIERGVRLARSRLPAMGSTIAVPLIVLVPLAAGLWDGYGYFEPGATEDFAPATTAQARCLEALPPGTVALVAGAPRAYARHGPSRYLGHDIDRRDLGNPSPALPIATGGHPLVILIHEWQRDMLDDIRAAYPGAASAEIQRPSGTRALTVIAVPEGGASAESLLSRCTRNARS